MLYWVLGSLSGLLHPACVVRTSPPPLCKIKCAISLFHCSYVHNFPCIVVCSVFVLSNFLKRIIITNQTKKHKNNFIHNSKARNNHVWTNGQREL